MQVKIFFAVGLGEGWYSFVALQTNFLRIIIAIYEDQVNAVGCLGCPFFCKLFDFLTSLR